MSNHALTPLLVDRAADIVRRRAGFSVSAALRSAFAAGLALAVERSPHADPARFVDTLEHDANALDDLMGEVVVGETYFMRHPEQCAFIRDELLGTLARRGGSRAVRIWSAGCATGEEPYTLGILCHEAGLAGRARILATDVSRRSLAQARDAQYGNWSLRGVRDEVRARWFSPAGGRWRLDPAIRRLVEFDYVNLGEASYPSLERHIWAMDLIVCRNVLIYFDRETVAAVAARLVASLAPDGCLILGASDPPIGDLVDCTTVMTPAGLAYRRATAAAPGGDPGRRYEVSSPAAVLATFEWPAHAEVPARVDLHEVPESPTDVAPPPPPPEPAEVAAGDALDEAGHLAQLYALRRYDEAARAALTVVQRGAAPPAAWNILVRSLANAGDLDAAGRRCLEALEAYPEDVALTHLHAVLLCEAGRPREAATVARRVIYLDRRFAMGHLALGAALSRLGDVRGARRSYRNLESLLGALQPDAPVPGADGETAERLLTLARLHLDLLGREAA
ncbi:MAG: CheR family methyltransferase [Gemmatimonadota bacterium]|nr:CheR family methyltransferase [Gemmatimonadota bacterium]